MRKALMCRVQGAKAFTLVELMIVVIIVAILALQAIPMYSGNVFAAKMAEGVAGCGTIRTAMRVYSATHNGSYPTLVGAKGNQLTVLNIGIADLEGKYFTANQYTINSNAAAYTITATLEGKDYTIDETGTEIGGYKTGQ